MSELQNLVTIVAGASSGIGRATALAFGRAGAKILVAGRREPEGIAVAHEIADAGGTAHFVRCDVSVEPDVAALVDRALELHPMLDRLVGPDKSVAGNGHPIGRCGRPEQVAHAILHFASPAAGFTTGQALCVDGGLTA